MQQKPQIKVTITPIEKINPLLAKAIRAQYPNQKVTHVKNVSTCILQSGYEECAQELFAICEEQTF